MYQLGAAVKTLLFCDVGSVQINAVHVALPVAAQE
jgi:hypothetical protein